MIRVVAVKVGVIRKARPRAPSPAMSGPKNQQTSVFSKNLQDIQQVDFVFFG